jgi:hypothetical protein
MPANDCPGENFHGHEGRAELIRQWRGQRDTLIEGTLPIFFYPTESIESMQVSGDHHPEGRWLSDFWIA